MIQYKKDSTVAIVATCAIVFCLFSFLFLYCYQTPTLAYEQHVLSGGVTFYRPLISSIVVTVIGLVIQMVVFAFTTMRGASHALTYLPSMLMLAFLTSGYPDANGKLTTGTWIWFVPVVLVVYLCLIKIIKQWIGTTMAPGRFLASKALSLNLLTMIVMMLYVCTVSNGDELFHRQIRAEKLLIENQYDELTKEGQGRSLLAQRTGITFFEKKSKNSEYTDSTLTLIRFIAMDKKHILADSAFTQPVVGGTASLMRLENVRPLLVSKRFLMRKKSFDYRLCALLAERDLDRFATMLSGKVNVNDTTACDTLPRHYKEALVLYQHLRSKPVTAYKDAVLETDYNDMRTMLQGCATEDERRMALQRNYRNNYWSYYFR